MGNHLATISSLLNFGAICFPMGKRFPRGIELWTPSLVHHVGQAPHAIGKLGDPLNHFTSILVDDLVEEGVVEFKLIHDVISYITD